MNNLKVLPLDLKREIPTNFVIEEQKVTDLSRDWYRPNYSPFFASGLEVYDGEGMLLTKNKDYTVEVLVHPLILKSGKEIRCFIKIKNKNLNLKGKYKFHYHSVGNTGFPNSMMTEMVDMLLNNRFWVDWETKVLGKPSTFPVFQHYHDVKTEVANWDEFIRLMEIRLDWLNTHRKAEWEKHQGRINQLATKFDNRLNELKQKLYDHDRTHGNVHGIKREDFDLPNIMNGKLATPEEDVLGLKSTAFTTPLGLHRSVRNNQVMSQRHVKIGDYPENYFSKLNTENVVRAKVLELEYPSDSGTWFKTPEDKLVFFTGYGDDIPITSFLYSNGVVQKTSSEYKREFSSIPFDLVCNTIDSGIMIGQSRDLKRFHYFPDIRNFQDQEDNHYVHVDVSEVINHLGEDWIKNTWVFSGPDGLYMLCRKVDGYLNRMTLFYTSIDELSPYATVKPTKILFNYERLNGSFGDLPTEEFYGFDVNIEASGKINHYHHHIDGELDEISNTNKSFTLFGAKDVYDKNRLYLKLLSSFVITKVGYVEIPIECCWVFDFETRTFLKMMGSGNRTSINPDSEEGIDFALLNFVSNVGINLGTFLPGGTYIQRESDNSYRYFECESYYPNDIFHYSFMDYLERSPIEFTYPVDLSSSFPINEWTVFTPNVTTVNYLGQNIKVEPNFYDIREYVDDYRSSEFFMVAQHNHGKLKYGFTPSVDSDSPVVTIAKIVTGENGIEKVDLKVN